MIDRVRKAARRADELLDDRQRKRLKALTAVERALFESIWQRLSEEVIEKNGRITSRRGFVSLSKTVDKVFDEIESQHIGQFLAQTAKDMRQVLEANQAQFSTTQRRADVGGVREAVEEAMRKKLGLDKDGNPARGGFLEGLVSSDQAREEIKKLVGKAVSGGVPMRKMQKALSVAIRGTDESAGVLERTIGGRVLDAYQAADRTASNEFAKRLGMRYFIYSGGLIETSRPFCRKRNNKVFTTEEAERDWPKDSTLPRTKAEKEAGGPPADYIPLQDCGRWNCRHRIMYIDEQAAMRMRPDLRVGAQPPAEPMGLADAKEKSGDMRVGSDPTGLPQRTGGAFIPRLGPAHQKGSIRYEAREAKREKRSSRQYQALRSDTYVKKDGTIVRGTDLKYTDENGAYSEERKALHNEIIADALAGVNAVENPTLYMMGGGPAAGKSTLIRQGVVVHPDSHVLLNPDEFKEDLPEYREGVKERDPLIAAYTHEESSHLNKEVMKLCAKGRVDTVWDGTGDGEYEKLVSRVAMFRKQGFRVIADYVTVPTEVAWQRAKARGEKVGRIVPEADVRNTHREVSNVLPRAVADGLFDEVTLWDTSTSELIKVMSAKGKAMIIYNRELWQRFLAKGQEPIMKGGTH